MSKKILTLDNVPVINKKIGKVDTIEKLKASTIYSLGDVVEVLGFHDKGDGSHHKRIAKAEDDGSGELGQNGIWWCIVHNGEVNVSWFGAKGDGIFDNTAIFSKVTSFAPKYSNIAIPDGIFRGNFVFQFQQVFGSGNTTLVPSLSTLPVVILRDPTGWDYQTLKDLKIDAENKSNACIQFGKGYEPYAGRWILKNLTINYAKMYGVKKPAGNIGCHWEECDFNGNPVSYYAHNEGEYEMHIGCDTFYKCHFGGSNKAVWYYKESPKTRNIGGQISIKDCIAEGNKEGACFIAEGFGYGEVSIHIQDTWFEANCVNPEKQVFINGKYYEARELHIEDVSNMVIEGTRIHSSFFKDSTVVLNRCSLQQWHLEDPYVKLGKQTQVESINSDVRLYDCYCKNGWSQVENDKSPLTVKNFKNTTNYVTTVNMGYFSNEPNALLVKNYPNAKLLFSKKNSNLSEKIEFIGGAYTTTVVNDGVSDKTCVEYHCTAGTQRSFCDFGITLKDYVGKHLVLSLSIKAIESNSHEFVFGAGSGDIGRIKLIKTGEWNHYRLCFKVSEVFLEHGNVGMWFKLAPIGLKFRLQNLQVLSFDTHQEAVGFLDGGIFLDVESNLANLTKQLDTPYYTLKMQQAGIYEDYVTYRDELHEYENSQTTDETMLLPVLHEPEIPQSVKVFAEKYKLI